MSGRIALNRIVDRLQLASPSTVTLPSPDRVDFQPFGALNAGIFERIVLEDPAPTIRLDSLDDGRAADQTPRDDADDDGCCGLGARAHAEGRT